MDIIAVANASRLPQRLISEGQRSLAACDHDGKSVPDKISPSRYFTAHICVVAIRVLALGVAVSTEALAQAMG